ncbi:hypothetical protein [uncultured Porticoccus sp.]|uniref:hypothetical protein n=1 Tax=uncultured Porticoccus sp. TaxID=1256050 RepID=UPI002615B249|nr:hypothetical protein [uncultured Porticoccus sp.]
MIDDPGSLDISKMKLTSLSFHWEVMFTRPTNPIDRAYKAVELMDLSQRTLKRWRETNASSGTPPDNGQGHFDSATISLLINQLPVQPRSAMHRFQFTL